MKTKIIEDKLFKKLPALESQLEDIETKTNSSYYLDSFLDKVVNGDYSLALNYINSIANNEGATIILSNKVYELKTPVIFTKPISIVGQGSRATVLKVLFNEDVITYRGNNTSYIALSNCGINKLSINSSVNNKGKLISFNYVAIGKCEDLIISNHGGHNIYFKASQDMVFNNLYIRNGGTLDTYSMVYFDQYDQGYTDNNCNDIEFNNCTFEHNEGQLVKSTGLNNNTIIFNCCKFEYNYSTTIPYGIELANAQRYEFINCRFNQYYNLFKLTNCKNINISGTSYIALTPNNFVELNNCVGIDITIKGDSYGAIVNNNSANINTKIVNTKTTSSVITRQMPNIPIQLENFLDTGDGANVRTLISDNTTSCGFAIKGDTTDWSRPLRVKITEYNYDEPLTICFKAKSSIANTEYEVGVVKYSGGYEQYLKIIRPSTNYDDFIISIPPKFLKANTHLYIKNKTTGGAFLTTTDIRYINRFYSSKDEVSNLPSTDFKNGFIVYSNNSTTNGDTVAWINVGNETQSQWKKFSIIS